MKKSITRIQQRSVILVNYDEKTHVSHISPDENVIGCLLSGRMIIHAEQSVAISRNQLFLLRAGEYYVEHLMEEGKVCSVIVVRFSDEELSTMMHHLSLCGDLPTTALRLPSVQPSSCTVQRASRILSTLFWGLREYLLNGLLERYGDVEQMKKNELCYLLMTDPLSPIARQLSLVSRGGVGSLQEIVERNIRSNRTISSLAEECGMSPSTFKKLFVELYGQPPHQWFLDKRLELARLQLIHTSDQVKRIGYECGFSSSSHLIRLFVKSYGMTPSVYRTRCRQQNVPKLGRVERSKD